MGQIRRWHILITVGVLAAASLGAEAQQAMKVARIGILCGVSCEGPSYDALLQDLQRLGWNEGRNLTVDRRGAGGQLDRLPALAAELVGLNPDVIVAVAPQPNRAAKTVAGTIPIVMVAVAGPVQVGLVQSLSRPGGNVTGLATLVPGGMLAKQLQLLKQALPRATRIAVLVNPTNEVVMKRFPEEVPPAATQLGVRLQVIYGRTADDLEGAFEAAARERAEALLVIGDPIFHSPPNRLPDLASRARLPAMYLPRELAQAGGLMSYGPDFVDMFRRAAGYIDKILKGAKPADLPVEQPTKFALVINLKTAKALGLTIPKSLLLQADEVIQ